MGDAKSGLLRLGDFDGLASRGVGSGVVSRAALLSGLTGIEVRGDVLRRFGAEVSIVAVVLTASFPSLSLLNCRFFGRWWGRKVAGWMPDHELVAYSVL